MNIGVVSRTIRQAQAGQFRRPEDGREPYPHVNDTKLESTREREDRSIYVNSQKAVTFTQEPSKSDFPKLFDPDAGIRFTTERIIETEKKDNAEEQYDRSGKQKTSPRKSESLVNDWA